MSPGVPADLVRLVRIRAANACEYCRMPESWQGTTFHIDHVRPQAHGGKTVVANLAFACVTCSLKKGCRTAAIDPRTGVMADFFNPRRDSWTTHFRWTPAGRIAGLTPSGRATALAFGMNLPAFVYIRYFWVSNGQKRPFD